MQSQQIRKENQLTDTSSDEDLVSGAMAGNTQAFEKIMRRYNQRSFRIARGYLNRDEDAMDVVQEAYVRAFTHLDQYAGPGKFSAWIGRIVRNEARMHLRKYKNVTYLTDEILQEMPQENSMNDPLLTGPENQIESRQIRQLIESAVNTLPEDFRLVFILRGVEQLSIDETSEITGIKAATVKTRYHRARNLVQAHIREHLDAGEMDAFSFAGHRCNYIVKTVLNRLEALGVCKGVRYIY